MPIPEPTVVTCQGGDQQITLYHAFTNKCPTPGCNTFYNGASHLLTNPRFGGEETGEAFNEDGNYVIGSGDPDYEPEEGPAISFTALGGASIAEVAYNALHELFSSAGLVEEDRRHILTTLLDVISRYCREEGEIGSFMAYLHQALQVIEDERIAHAEAQYQRDVLGDN